MGTSLQSCPVCKKTEHKRLYPVLQGELLQCQKCNLVFFTPRPSFEDLTTYYNATKYRDEYKASKMAGLNFAQARYQHLHQAIEHYAPEILKLPHRKLLDIGCGEGDLLKIASNNSWDVAGVELSQSAVEQANTLIGETVVQVGDLKSVNLPDSKYNLVTSYHVIEHLLDPISDLTKINQLLEPGGIAFIETPNINSLGARLKGKKWSHIIPPEHINYFNSKSLTRDSQMSAFRNLFRLEILDKVQVLSAALNDFRSVLQVFSRVNPDEVYNLAGQSSVGLSFEQPVETLESIATGTLNLLEVIRFLGKPIKFYNAGSSECFGNSGNTPSDENTPFRPRSPYGVAKSASFWEVAIYREAYSLFACSGILFNHESPLRPERFVTQKIITSACRIALGLQEKLSLGNLAVERDWGWAPEYVEAMYLMLQQDQPDDYVIATGNSEKLESFVSKAFAELNLDWHDHVIIDSSLFRPTDLTSGRGNPTKAKEKLGWQTKYRLNDIIKMMIREKMDHLKNKC